MAAWALGAWATAAWRGTAWDEGEATEETPVSRNAGFEMVSIEPAWRKALRLRKEAKDRLKVRLEGKKAKKAQLIEKIAAKEALSDKPESQIEIRLKALLAEWVELKPSIQVDMPGLDDAETAFMAQVALYIERIKQDEEDTDHRVRILLLT